MKQTLILFFGLLAFTLSGQGTVDKKVTAALNSGDIQALYEVMASEVELCFPEREGIETPESARRKLRAFFEKHPPVSFSGRHKGEAGQKGKYSIGTLKTESGSFRVFIYVEGAQGQRKLRELRFERPL